MGLPLPRSNTIAQGNFMGTIMRGNQVIKRKLYGVS